MSKKNHKYPKNVRCCDIIKRYTMEHLATFTKMSVGEIFDRLIEGKGILTIDDNEILEKSHKLWFLLKKIDFPKHKNLALHEHLQKVREEYKHELTKLISVLEPGSKPVYLEDLANDRYLSEFKKIGAVVHHNTINFVFMDKIRKEMLMDYPNDKFITAYYRVRNYEKRIFLRNKTEKDNDWDFRADLYRKSKLGKWKTEEILDDIYNKVIELYTKYTEIDDFGYQTDDLGYEWYYLDIQDADWYILHFSALPQDATYSIMTRHPEEFSSYLFRKLVEYIACIPSITGQRSNEIKKQLDYDIELLSKKLVAKKEEWFDECRKNDPPSFSEKLINRFDKLMEGFNIPEITIEEQTAKVVDQSKITKRKKFLKNIEGRITKKERELYIEIGELFIPVDYIPYLDAIGTHFRDIHKFIPVDYRHDVDYYLELLEEKIINKHPEYVKVGINHYLYWRRFTDKCKSYRFKLTLKPKSKKLSVWDSLLEEIRYFKLRFTEPELSILRQYIQQDNSIKLLPVDSLKEYNKELYWLLVYNIMSAVWIVNQLVYQTKQRDYFHIKDFEVYLPIQLIDDIMNDNFIDWDNPDNAISDEEMIIY